MPIDPSIPLSGRTPAFSLFDLGDVLARRQQLEAQQLTIAEAQRQQAEDAAIRDAYAQQYGAAQGLQMPGTVAPQGPGTGIPQGLQPPPGIQERQLGGTPSAAFPHQMTPPSQAQGLQMAQQGPQPPGMSQGQAPQDKRSQEAFIRQLYTISPRAGREAEAHAFTLQATQLSQHQEKLAYMGRIARGVLESNTQQAYDLGRQMMLQAGMPAQDLPEVYDPDLMRLYATTFEDAGMRLDRQKLQLEAAKLQRELAQAPAYTGDKTLDAALYAKYGAQIPPGGRPTPAMVADVRQQLMREGPETAYQQKVAEKEAERTVALPQEARRAQRTLTGLERQWQTVDEDIDRALELIDTGQVTGLYSHVAKVKAGTPQFRMQQLLNTIRANIGFDRLQQMRESSPNGAALGQVTEYENRLLQATAGSLEQDLDATTLKYNLLRIKENLRALQDDRRQAYEEDYGAVRKAPPPITARTPAERQRLMGPQKSPYADVPAEKLTPEQMAEEEAWLLKQLGGQ